MKLRLKEVAKNKNVSLKSIADKLGITPESLSRRCNGNTNLKSLQDIANAVECSIYELLPHDDTFNHFYDSKQLYQGVRRIK